MSCVEPQQGQKLTSVSGSTITIVGLILILLILIIVFKT